MDKLITNLLAIETTAKDSLADLEDEHMSLAQRITDEISRHTLDIKRERDKQIQTLKQDAEESVTAKLAEIETSYNHSAAQLKELFDENLDKWRDKWAARAFT